MPSAQVIWIIDDEQWPRALLRAELIERGYEAIGFETIADALDSRLDRPPRAIVVELRGQRLVPSALEKLLAAGPPVILLAGMPEADDPRVKSRAWAAVLHRPVSIGEIAEAVSKAARPDPGNAPKP
jgi:DNA-binding response OmpR family regulator